MENYSDNPVHELDQLKQNYKSFGQSLEGHQIIDNDKVQYVVNNRSSYFQRHRRNVLICYPLAMVFFAGSLFLASGNVAFCVLLALILLVGMMAELWITKDLSISSNKIGLVTWAQHHYAAKLRFFLYYLVLICSLLFITFMASVPFDVPNHLIGTVKIVIISLLVLSLIGFLMLYIPIYRQCNEVLHIVNSEVEKTVGQSIGFRFLGFMVLLSIAFTAAFKLMDLPGGTLLMLFSGLMIVAYAVVGAVRLRLRRHCPLILSILIILIAPIITYLVMSHINKWPLGGPDPYSYYVAESNDDSLSNADIALVEVCADYRPTLTAEVQSHLLQSGIKSITLPDSPALVAISVADTARANALLAECCPLNEGLTPCWSLPDTCGQSMLFLVHSTPIAENHPGQSPIFNYASMTTKFQQPYSLYLVLCSEAETAWQAAVFQFVQRHTPATVAVVVNGMVVCHGVVDRSDIGYQNLNFRLSPSSTISEPLLDAMIKGKE